jgi:hypothetical protein
VAIKPLFFLLSFAFGLDYGDGVLYHASTVTCVENGKVLPLFIPEKKRGVCHLHQKPDDVRSTIATALLSVACTHTDLRYIYSLVWFLRFLELDLQHPDADMRGTRPKTHRNEVS